MLSSSDWEQVQAVLTQVIGTHHLNVVTPSFNPVCQVNLISSGNFRLVDLQWQAALQIEQQQPDALYVIYLVLAGAIEQQIDQNPVIHSSPDTAVILSPGQVSAAITSDQGQALLISIEQQLIELALETLLERSLKQPIVFEPVINLTHNLGGSLKEFVQFLWQGLAREAALSPLVIAELEQAFLACLLKGVPHNYSEALLQHCIGALPCYVQKAQAFMVANLQADLRLEDISTAVGVSSRLLEKAFACHCDCSPMQFLKQMRLRRVREELCQATPETRVVDVMIRHGFDQGGKFARAYREMFGELPSETLRRHQKLNES
jgi:AraC-like DNA-binding protein